MAEKTEIAWTDSTFNPWWGCVKKSAGCRSCYAETHAIRFAGVPIWGAGSERRTFGDKHWEQPLRWNRKAEREGRRLRVFCGSMMDVFEDHPTADKERPRLWDLIRQTPALDWQLLTKRPENIGAMLPDGFWPNVWLGTSVEDDRVVDRVEQLRAHRARAPVLFLSVEPMIGAVHLDFPVNPVDWVIIGGESGHGARPMRLHWVRQLLTVCEFNSVPVFVKQMGSHWAKQNGAQDSKGAVPTDWPEDLRVREFPISHLLTGHH